MKPIEGRLEQMWPNLRSTDDTAFWKIEWAHHGMCSEYPQDPFGYFNATLNLAETHQFNPFIGNYIYKFTKYL